MGNALALILGAVERERTVPFVFTGSRNRRGIRPELAEVREVKAMVAAMTGNCQITRAWRNWISGPGMWPEESMKRKPPGASRRGTSRNL